VAHSRGMSRPFLKIDVAKKDQRELRKLLKGDVQPVRVVLRATGAVAIGGRQQCTADRQEVIPLTPQAIRRLGHRYEQNGLDGASMRSKGRWGRGARHHAERASYRDGVQRSSGGSYPVDGAAGSRRSLKADVGRETIRILLLHHDLKPWHYLLPQRRIPAGTSNFYGAALPLTRTPSQPWDGVLCTLWVQFT
jgi:putative transposase